MQPRRHACSSGKIVTIDGSHKNPVTDGYICAKVRKFGERVYGPDRLLYPAVRERTQGRRAVQARVVGRSASSSSRRRFAAGEGGSRRRVDPALLLRRIERPADAGQHRRAAVAAVRHVAPGAHRVRGADRRGQHGALRQDAVGHLSGLPGGQADHPVGREPVGVGHPPDPVRARGAEARREARRHRPARRRRWRARPTFTCRSSPAPTSSSRWRSIGISSRTATPTRRSCASTRAAPDRCASAPSRGRSSARPKSPASTPSAIAALATLVRRELAGAHPLRLGPRAQPQRRQRRDGGPRAARGRRQVRRARRRLLDEQLGVVEHRPRRGSTRRRTGRRASST